MLVDPLEDDPHGVLVVKDPLTLDYFRLGPREAFVLRSLYHSRSLDDLHRAYRARFPDEGISREGLLAFCASLAASGLLSKDRPADPRGVALGTTATQPADRSLVAQVLSPLAIRLPGFDPTGLLGVLAPVGRLLYSRAAVLAASLASVLVVTLLIGRADELLSDAGRAFQLWDPRYAAAALLAVVVAKAWHELGHALACRRMGAACHDVGLMLLAFVPCPYCDVTDAWVLRERWKRAVVAFGGVYFEWLLAIAAAAVWLVLAPGPARVLATATLMATTVSTLLVNLNPLLRFDGYYVLADLWGVANLRERSRRALWSPVSRWVTGAAYEGTVEGGDEADASPALLAAYGAAAIVYTAMVLACLLWFVYLTLAELGFRASGDAVVALSLLGVGLAALRSACRPLIAAAPMRRAGVAARSLVVALAAGVALAGVAALRVEQTLHSPCRLEGVESAELVAPSAGTLVTLAAYGDRLAPGDAIATIDHLADRLRALELAEKQNDAATRVATLETRSTREPELLAELSRARIELAEARRQREAHRRELEGLRLVAPIAGRLAPPAPRGEASGGDELPSWTGAPLDPANRGCGVERGEVIARVTSDELRAVVLLDQSDSALVRPGNRVRIALDRAPDVVLGGEVERVAVRPLDTDAMNRDRTPRADTVVSGSTTERAIERTLRGPLDTHGAYRVAVRLEIGNAVCQPGALGQARIVTGDETVAGRVWRWLCRLVRFG